MDSKSLEWQQHFYYLEDDILEVHFYLHFYPQAYISPVHRYTWQRLVVIEDFHISFDRFTSDEKANQNNAYEFMQLKNDHEICKKQKLQLEEDLLDVKQDCEELERKLK